MVEITLEGRLGEDVRQTLQNLSESNLKIQEIASKAATYKTAYENVQKVSKSISISCPLTSDMAIACIRMHADFLLSEPNFKQYLDTLPEQAILTKADKNTINGVLDRIGEQYKKQATTLCEQLTDEMERKKQLSEKIYNKRQIENEAPVNIDELVKIPSKWKKIGIAAAETLLAVAILGYTACRYGPEIKEYLFPETNCYEVRK